MLHNTALLIIDMQKGSFTPKTPRYNAKGIIDSITKLTTLCHASELPVIYIQHDGTGTGELEKHTQNWEILEAFSIHTTDIIIHKRANDAFYDTTLEATLKALNINNLIITGCATDFCVASTIQSALIKNYNITVVEDGHTTADRPYVNAENLIKHYNWIWQNLTPTEGQITVKNFEHLKGDF
ncbi:isochorismatase family protein [Formosa sediminum]|uniref:Isochorismatase family protein n=1 Tax=Formosa sediminum TaxID=2594004 RepID=A0A516GVB4_9FLAO|nr:isochorismatase family protein [Formosa sediminum]QDO95464.1 isochorismatase family protein [Formosa sediminum]